MAGVLLAALLGGPAMAAANDTSLVSRSAITGEPGGGRSSDMSADGRFVVFVIHHPLVADDTDGDNDVFVRDTVTGTTTMVSRNTAGHQANESSDAPRISADGRFVAFSSYATNLDPDDTSRDTDVYVRDLHSGVTILASRGQSGQKANAPATAPDISGDGRYVAFESTATNLHAEDRHGQYDADIFVRDLHTGTNSFVNRASGANGAAGDNNAFGPRISSDGRHVAFESFAGNLGGAAGNTHAYVRNLESNTTTLVSRASGANGEVANSWASWPHPSADGSRIVFLSRATNLAGGDTDEQQDVFVRDLTTNTTTLVSRDTGANGAKADNCGGFKYSLSGSPHISDDGRHAAFHTTACNFDPADTDPVDDVYVRDLVGATTTLASRASGSDGAKGDGGSAGASLSADGRFVAFDSDANNLVAGPQGSGSDVFRRDFGPRPVPPADTPAGSSAGEPSGGGAGQPLGERTPLAISLAGSRLRAVSGKRFAIRFSASEPGEVAVELRRGRRSAAWIHGRAQKGRNVLWVPARPVSFLRGRSRALAPGSYSLRLAVRGADGRRASKTVKLQVVRAQRRR